MALAAEGGAFSEKLPSGAGFRYCCCCWSTPFPEAGGAFSDDPVETEHRPDIKRGLHAGLIRAEVPVGAANSTYNTCMWCVFLYDALFSMILGRACIIRQGFLVG